MKVQFYLLLIILASFYSCKKDASFDNLSNVILKKEGILRVECKNCGINYDVQSKGYSVDVASGSNDIKFFYSSDFNLKTQVFSKVDQNIRLVVIDSFGRIVSNELQSFSEGEVKEKTFTINTK